METHNANTPSAPAATASTLRYRSPADANVARWWAMSAIYNRSMRALEELRVRGVEAFVPMHTVVRTVGRRKVRQEVPAVSNLIFVRTTEVGVQQAKDALGYLQFLCNREAGRNVRIVVPDEDMESFIRLSTDSGHRSIYLTPDETGLEPGDRVRIHGGAFDGVVGTFRKVQGKHRRMVVVTIPTVMSVATLSFSPELLERLDG